MYYNVALGDARNFYFLLKKLFNSGTGMGRGYQTRRGRGCDSISHPRWVWLG